MAHLNAIPAKEFKLYIQGWLKLCNQDDRWLEVAFRATQVVQ